MMNLSVTHELICTILETSFDAIPKDIVERTKYLVIDTIGCAIGGATAPGCPEMIDAIREWGGKGESTVLAYGLMVPSYNAALANAVMARIMDYGPVDVFVEGEAKPSHISETLVPTALAVAEQRATGGRELLTALILGADLIARIMGAIIRFDSSLDSEVIRSKLSGRGISVFGASAVTGRLSGLGEHELINAFGIALNEMSSKTQNIYDSTHCFMPNEGLSAQLGLSVGMGLAAQLGIFAAGLATKGITGINDPLIGKHGYFALYCQDYHPEILTKDLGKKFYTEITFKPYSSCRGTHGGIDCALEIVRKHELDANDIDEVTVNVSPWARDFIMSLPFEIDGAPHYAPNLNAHQSLQYNVANALVRKSVSLEHFFEDYVRDPEIMEMVKKVKITSEGWPVFPDETFAQAMTVKVSMKNGQEFFEHVNVPKGNEIHNPLTKDEIKDKFRSNVDFSKKVAMDNAEEALGMLEKLEEIDDISKIIKLL